MINDITVDEAFMWLLQFLSTMVIINIHLILSSLYRM